MNGKGHAGEIKSAHFETKGQQLQQKKIGIHPHTYYEANKNRNTNEIVNAK